MDKPTARDPVPPGRKGRWKVFLCGLIGGAVLFAVLASAMSMTDTRPFCTTCHLMAEAGVTHKLSTHADRTCNECHLPHAIAAKLPAKAAEGLRDFVFNLQGKDLPLGPSEETRKMVNDNCIACHAKTNVDVASMLTKPYCTDCHRNVAHMRHKPVSTRMVAYE